MPLLLAALLACTSPAPDSGTSSDGGSTQDGGGSTQDGGGSTQDGGGSTQDGGGSTEDGGGSTQDGGASEPPVALYVLTGQSNSLGTTQFEGSTPADYGPGPHAADAATAFVWSNVSAAATTYPPALYGDSGGEILALQIQQGGGSDPAFWGPEFGLARALLEAGDDDVLVIKASRGGGGNTWWHAPAYETDPDSGHMWGHLLDVTDAAVGLVHAGGRRVELRAFLYLQGESNSDAEADVAGERLALLIEGYAAHLEGLEPGSTADMHTVIGEIAASDSTSARSKTTFQQQQLATSDPDISFVETHDLPLKADGIHFGKEAKLEIGARFAEALLATD